MKVKGSELAEVIRIVVREELGKVLPNMIREHLSEQYIKKVLTNNRQYSLSEDLDDEEEEIPSVQKNDHRGIYHENNPMMVNRKVESKNPLVQKSNPLSFLYEDVMPVSNNPMASLDNDEGISFDKLGLDINRMKKLAGGVVKKQEVVENTVKKFNSELDRIVDTRPLEQRTQSVAPRETRKLMSERRSHDGLDGPVFPDSPIVLGENE